MLQQKEKQAKRQERRDQKGKTTSAASDDPMNDPTIDWNEGVREQPEAVVEEDEAVEAETGREA